jgi:hypothetical protein
MSKGRRQMPSTTEGRRRKSELGQIISNPKTSKADRAAALAELDRIAPFPSKEPFDFEDTKPTREDLEDLIDRVEVAREKGTPEKSIPPAPPDDWPKFSAAQERKDRERSLRKAQAATPLEKARVIIAELPNHPLQKLTREVAQWLHDDDHSNPKPSVEQLTRSKVQGWLAKEPYNRHDVRGNTDTVADAVADVYRLVTERDAADPGWFVRRTMKLLDEPTAPAPTAQQTQPQMLAPMSPTLAEVAEPKEPQPDGIQRAGIDLRQRATLLLSTDQWLTRLSTHSSETHEQIIGAIVSELLTAGHLDRVRAAEIYNRLRPRALNRTFPERKF